MKKRLRLLRLCAAGALLGACGFSTPNDKVHNDPVQWMKALETHHEVKTRLAQSPVLAFDMSWRHSRLDPGRPWQVEVYTVKPSVFSSTLLPRSRARSEAVPLDERRLAGSAGDTLFPASAASAASAADTARAPDEGNMALPRGGTTPDTIDPIPEAMLSPAENTVRAADSLVSPPDTSTGLKDRGLEAQATVNRMDHPLPQEMVYVYDQGRVVVAMLLSELGASDQPLHQRLYGEIRSRQDAKLDESGAGRAP